MKGLLFFILIPLVEFAQLSKIVDEWKNDKLLLNSSIGFSVLDAKSGRTLEEYNSHLALIPASTLKIFTTAAALKVLGPGYKYETKIYHTGTLDRSTGILNGDLIIAGSGDPTLQSENFPQQAAITDAWALTLKQKGFKEIKGKIIADASRFERFIPGSWLWEDISNYFGAGAYGISFMDNKFAVGFDTKETGSIATSGEVVPNYLSKKITLLSEVSAGGNEDQAYIYSDPFAYEKRASGTLPPNKSNYKIEGALPDPPLLCAEYFYSSLLKVGIKCEKDAPVSKYKADKIQKVQTLLISNPSPPLSSIVYFTNQNSINFYAESLLRTLGEGEEEKGIRTIKKFCHKLNLDTSEICLRDGCGLSRVNSTTTNLQAQLLSTIYNDSIYKFFNASLPLAGKNGSMSNIGKGTYIENNLRAKTGYVQRVRAYCGYLTTRSGRDLAFSIIFNNYNCTPREARLKIEKFMIALAEIK